MLIKIVTLSLTLPLLTFTQISAGERECPLIGADFRGPFAVVLSLEDRTVKFNKLVRPIKFVLLNRSPRNLFFRRLNGLRRDIHIVDAAGSQVAPPLDGLDTMTGFVDEVDTMSCRQLTTYYLVPAMLVPGSYNIYVSVKIRSSESDPGPDYEVVSAPILFRAP